MAETALVRTFRQPAADRLTDEIRPGHDRPRRALPGGDRFQPGYAVVGDPDRKMLAASRSLRAHADQCVVDRQPAATVSAGDVSTCGNVHATD
jgi:hypothetical protein